MVSTPAIVALLLLQGSPDDEEGGGGGGGGGGVVGGDDGLDQEVLIDGQGGSTNPPLVGWPATAAGLGPQFPAGPDPSIPEGTTAHTVRVAWHPSGRFVAKMLMDSANTIEVFRWTPTEGFGERVARIVGWETEEYWQANGDPTFDLPDVSAFGGNLVFSDNHLFVAGSNASIGGSDVVCYAIPFNATTGALDVSGLVGPGYNMLAGEDAYGIGLLHDESGNLVGVAVGGATRFVTIGWSGTAFTGQVTEVTGIVDRAYHLRQSPDGRFLAVGMEEGFDPSLTAYPLTGGLTVGSALADPVGVPDTELQGLDWAPDSTRLYYATIDEAGSFGFNTAGGGAWGSKVVLDALDAEWGAFFGLGLSPRGDLVLLVGDHTDNSPRGKLLTVTAGGVGTEVDELTWSGSSPFTNASVAWRPFYVAPAAPALAPPTAGEITAALAGLRGPVTAAFRYEERDHDYRFVSDITPSVYEATIELDNDRPVVRTAKLLIDANSIAADFDPRDSHITIIEDLQVETFQYGEWHDVTVSFPLGLFHLEAPRLIVQSNGRRFWEAEAADVTTHFVTSKTTTPYVVAAGTNYITAVEGVCELLGVRYLFSPNTAVTPVAFTWAPGTSYLQIANDLLMGINFYPLWATVDGVITSRLRVLPAVENAAVEYSTEAEPRMLVSPFERADDTSRFANRVAVVIDDPRRTPEYALRVNNDPESSISIASLDGAVNSAPAISGGRVVNIATAGAIAEFELAKYAADAERGRLLTFPDPRRDAHEFYRLTVEDDTVDAIWMARGWRLALHPVREMEHEVGLAIDLNEAIVITLSGTILTATEAQIVSGGRTMILTLPTGYTWRAAGAEFDAQKTGIIDGLVSSGTEDNGWNVRVQPVVLPANIVRTSATVVTITLPAAAGYNITLPETITVSIPVTAIAEYAESYVEPGATIIPT